MTRINVLEPHELTDKHLVAEYHEISRVYKLARVPKDGEKFPKEYVLGKGHVQFFYDKLSFITKRHRQLFNEMKIRGFKPNGDFMVGVIENAYLTKSVHLWNDYIPTEQAIELNRKRIKERLLKNESE